MPSPQRICLLGAGGTGKTTLAQALAAHFGGLWVPEHLRATGEPNGRHPTAEEQAALMRAQFEQEEQVVAQALQAACRYVFCDGAPLLTAIYSAHHFSDRSLFDCAHALHARYALTLFLQPDLPGMPNGLQGDGPAVRAAVHTRLRQALQDLHVPCIEIEGQDEARLQAAILAVETLTG